MKAALLTSFVALACVLPASAGTSGTTARVSVSGTGAQADSASWATGISADGRYTVFDSHATNLVAGDTNGQPDAFVHDSQIGATERVSVASNGRQADYYSHGAGISADGRFVVFTSAATNLVPGDTNDRVDVFVHDRLSGATRRVSVTSSGGQANADSDSPVISADGRYIAFASHASNLVPHDTNLGPDVFVHDLVTGKTTRVSVNSRGRQASPKSESGGPAISTGGRYVAFSSNATNLVRGDTNGLPDVFVRDRKTGRTTRVSVDSRGRQAGRDRSRTGSSSALISGDGRYVGFLSSDTNLVRGDTNRWPDVFVRDRRTGRTIRVSVSSDGKQANAESGVPVMSPDGRLVAFSSYTTTLVPDQTGGLGELFVHDLATGSTELVSKNANGEPGNDASSAAAFSADDRHLAFSSWASNLVAGDTNQQLDVFVHDFGV
jgi:Tol biopolymer transport system component